MVLALVLVLALLAPLLLLKLLAPDLVLALEELLVLELALEELLALELELAEPLALELELLLELALLLGVELRKEELALRLLLKAVLDKEDDAPNDKPVELELKLLPLAP